MIAVYIVPGAMQIVQGTRKGDKLVIQSAETFSHAYFDIINQAALEKYEPEDVQRLSGLFYEIKEYVRERSPLYIVLPDFLFDKTDCFLYQTDEDISQYLQRTPRGENGYYYSVPLVTAPVPTSKHATVYAIYREVVDILLEAAALENVNIFSVEPASFSYLRASGLFTKEELSFYSFEKGASFVAYSDIAGICKLNVPELASSELQMLSPDKQEELVREYLISFEATASETFIFMNQNLPITVFASKSVRSLPSFSDRLPESAHFPGYIEDGGVIGEGRHRMWMSVAGTLLQDVDFSKDAFSELIEPYETVRSANVLPEEIRHSVQHLQYLDRLEKFLAALAAVLAAAVVVVFVCLLFISEIHFPDRLAEDYAEAQANMDSVQQQIAVISLREKEHEFPLEGLASCLAAKPETISFVQFSAAAPKNAKDPWLRLKVVSPDAVVFQDYLSSLSKSELFSEVVISQIASDASSGYKTAEFIFRKEKPHE